MPLNGAQCTNPQAEARIGRETVPFAVYMPAVAVELLMSERRVCSGDGGDGSALPMEALQPGDPGSVGGYRLLGRLGAGGMGRVFLGVSPGGRKVAVKLIHPAHADAAQFRERFAREIEAAQRVGGFHTASVVDADPHADPPWMVTAFIEGPSLQDDVDRSGPLPPQGVRALGAGLAEGLAAIHARGLVHRDLKPGNVIMAADGPRIIDFGIARAVDATTGITTTGVVVGTVAYMSPEQIRGEVAGPASDVFSLGSVLGFAAIGRPPFGGDSAVSIMFRVVNEPPDLAGVADGELRGVIAACLAKSPADRPAIRSVLAALSNPIPMPAAFTDPVPTPAVLSSPVQPSAAPRAPAGPPPAAAGYETSTRSPAPARTETGPGQQMVPPPATTPPSKAASPRPASPRPASHRAAPPSGGPPRTAPPRTAPPRTAPPRTAPPRTAPPRAGHRRRTALIATVTAAAAVAIAVVLTFSLAPGGTPGSAGAAAGHRTGATASVGSVATRARTSPDASPRSPKAQTSASTSTSGTVPLRDFTLRVPATSGINDVSFSADGRLLADTSADGFVYVWNLATGGLAKTLATTSQSTGTAAFSLNGTLLATGTESDDRVYVWNVATGQRVATLTNTRNSVQALAFSPNGKFLAVGDAEHVFLWNLVSDTLSFDFATASVIDGVAFSPDGTLLAAAGGTSAGPVFLWDVATGQRLAALYAKGTAGYGVQGVAFSPDGTLLAAASGDGDVYLWGVTSHNLAATFRTSPSRLLSGVAYSPGGTLVAAGVWGAGVDDVYLWNVTTGKLAGTVPDPGANNIWDVAFSPDGKFLAFADGTGEIYVKVTSQLVP